MCHIEAFRNKMQLNIVIEPFINVLRAYLNIYYANDSVRYSMSTESISASRPVRELSSPRVGNPRVVQ